MQAIVTLKEAISGYWDGGKKKVFTLELDRSFDGSLYIKSDSKGKFIKVHCYAANHYWHVFVGKTEKQTLSYAVRHFSRHCIESVEYINE